MSQTNSGLHCLAFLADYNLCVLLQIFPGLGHLVIVGIISCECRSPVIGYRAQYSGGILLNTEENEKVVAVARLAEKEEDEGDDEMEEGEIEI